MGAKNDDYHRSMQNRIRSVLGPASCTARDHQERSVELVGGRQESLYTAADIHGRIVRGSEESSRLLIRLSDFSYFTTEPDADVF